VRIEATKALSELKHVGGLIEASKNDNSDVRFEAVSALENVDETEAALAAIIDVLTTDENETVYKLLDAYLILSMRGSAMDGTPLE
jgi:HEAT repeat protein